MYRKLFWGVIVVGWVAGVVRGSDEGVWEKEIAAAVEVLKTGGERQRQEAVGRLEKLPVSAMELVRKVAEEPDLPWAARRPLQEVYSKMERQKGVEKALKELEERKHWTEAREWDAYVAGGKIDAAVDAEAKALIHDWVWREIPREIALQEMIGRCEKLKEKGCTNPMIAAMMAECRIAVTSVPLKTRLKELRDAEAGRRKAYTHAMGRFRAALSEASAGVWLAELEGLRWTKQDVEAKAAELLELFAEECREMPADSLWVADDAERLWEWLTRPGVLGYSDATLGLVTGAVKKAREGSYLVPMLEALHRDAFEKRGVRPASDMLRKGNGEGAGPGGEQGAILEAREARYAACEKTLRLNKKCKRIMRMMCEKAETREDIDMYYQKYVEAYPLDLDIHWRKTMWLYEKEGRDEAFRFARECASGYPAETRVPFTLVKLHGWLARREGRATEPQAEYFLSGEVMEEAGPVFEAYLKVKPNARAERAQYVIVLCAAEKWKRADEVMRGFEGEVPGEYFGGADLMGYYRRKITRNLEEGAEGK